MLASLVSRDTVLLSILAGTEIASLAARLPGAGAIVRVMPNLSAAIGNERDENSATFSKSREP